MTKVNTQTSESLADIATRYLDEYKTKSAVIRKLASEGHKRADIARAMGIRYQHVRNVLEQEAIKQEQEAKKNKK